MCQQGESVQQQKFRQALKGPRHNSVALEDWELLSTRVQSELSIEEVATIDDALRIYGKKYPQLGINLNDLPIPYY